MLVAFCRICYTEHGARALHKRMAVGPLWIYFLGDKCFYLRESPGKGECCMITYMELFTFCLVILGMVEIFVMLYIAKKK